MNNKDAILLDEFVANFLVETDEVGKLGFGKVGSQAVLLLPDGSEWRTIGEIRHGRKPMGLVENPDRVDLRLFEPIELGITNPRTAKVIFGEQLAGDDFGGWCLRMVEDSPFHECLTQSDFEMRALAEPELLVKELRCFALQGIGCVRADIEAFRSILFRKMEKELHRRFPVGQSANFIAENEIQLAQGLFADPDLLPVDHEIDLSNVLKPVVDEIFKVGADPIGAPFFEKSSEMLGINRLIIPRGSRDIVPAFGIDERRARDGPNQVFQHPALFSAVDSNGNRIPKLVASRG